MLPTHPRNRFSWADDLMLLRQVSEINPYVNKHKWETIQQHVASRSHKNFTIRSVKERTEMLIKGYHKNLGHYPKKFLESREQYEEKLSLLKKVFDLRLQWQRAHKNIMTRRYPKERRPKSAPIASDQAAPPADNSVQSSDPLDSVVKTENVEESFTEEFQLIVEPPPLNDLESVSPSFVVIQEREEIPRANVSQVEEPSDRILHKREEKANFAKILRKKRAIQALNKQKELELEEKKLKLEEYKLKLQREEFEFNKEVKNREYNLQKMQFERQEKLIDKLLNHALSK